MNFDRVMIAAPKSGSGKTTITCALLQVLKEWGKKVVSYKCGPDYIDPMFHEKIIEVPSKNLDTFFTGEEKTKELFLKDKDKEDFVVLEGVMGLYDGLGGIREEGSSYHLAKVTKTPIILVVDAKGMGRSVISLIAGFLAYDKEHLIQGVILNRMSKSYYEILKPLLEEELQISILGYFPEHKNLHMASRHLGLVMPDEIACIQEQLQYAAEAFRKTVSVEEILQMAKKAEEFCEEGVQDSIQSPKRCEKIKKQLSDDKPVIAVARDEAFCFYYADNLLMLKEKGAELKFFSPLHDSKVPTDCHALLIGGGYPEQFARQLSVNQDMIDSIQKAAQRGMPMVAECGGFMYLHETLIDKEGVCYKMAAVVPAVCSYTDKLVRFGYIELQEKQSSFGSFLPKGERIRGHEFHYYDSTNNGDSCLAKKTVTGKEYSCIIEGENYWFGFPHLYYPSNPAFVKKFVEKARKYKGNIDT